MSEAAGCGRKERGWGGRLRPLVVLALAWVLLAACAPTGPVSGARISERNEASTRRPSDAAPDEICVRGRLTDEGVECQAMHGPEGRLYTLIGPAAPAVGGDVCVCGRIAELSSCMQGTTLVVTRIGPPDGCP